MHSMDKQEQEWIRRAQNGDKASMDHLVERYREDVLRFCGKFCYQDADAEDAAQEVRLRAMKYIHNFRIESSFKSWLYKICVNVCIDLAKKRKGSEALGIGAPLSLDDISETGGMISPSAEEVALENIPFLEAVKQDLTEREFMIMVLRYQHKMTEKEIAAEHPSLKFSRSVLHRIQQKLQRAFEKTGERKMGLK